MKRYRYILSGTALGTDKISSFRLIAGNNLGDTYDGDAVLRVNIPDGLELTKYDCDPYSTTEDERTLEELGYDVLMWSKKLSKWLKREDLKGVKPCDMNRYPVKKK